MKSKFEGLNSGRVIIVLLGIITFILIAAVLKITSSLLMPFTIAVLLSFVSYPIAKFLERFRIPRIASAISILIIILGIFYGMGMILYSSGQTLSTLYPQYEERIRETYIIVSIFFDLPYDAYMSIFENIWSQAEIRLLARDVTLSFTNQFIIFLANTFLVGVFMVCLLLEAGIFRKKLARVFISPRAERIMQIGSDLISKVTNYLFIMFFISILNGLLVGLSLTIIGVEFAAVWGVMQFVLNFIPNIGSIISGVGATAFAFLQFWPDGGPIIATGIVMLGTNLLCGFIILPKMMGDSLGLSPLAIVGSLLIWGFIWGFGGLILAVPMMAIIKIVCENIPILEPFAVMLGSRKDILAWERKAQD